MHLVFLILLGLTLLLLVGQTINLATMRHGDGFSRSMAESFGALGTCVLWGLIAVLLGLARRSAAFPSGTGWASILLLPLGGAGMLRLNRLMRSYEYPRGLIVCGVMPALLLTALSVMVQLRSVPAWLDAVGISVALGSGAAVLAAIPLCLRRKR